jgi:hypothetical protein
MLVGMSQQYCLCFSASGGRESCVEAYRIGVKKKEHVRLFRYCGNLQSVD